jgi:hypothetical protein
MMRRIAVWLSLGAFAIGALPAAALYRCSMAGKIMSAPCCKHGDEPASPVGAVDDASCCERIAAATVQVAAVREAAPPHAAPPLAVLYTLPQPAALPTLHAPRLRSAWLRAGPP